MGALNMTSLNSGMSNSALFGALGSPEVRQSFSANGVSHGNPDADWFTNLFTGDRDYGRQWELMLAEQAFNSAEAAKNRTWQEYMSNTSYQRRLNDMRAAGLNPYLAYNAGGASTPGGATASTGSRTAQRSGDGALRLFSTVLNTAMSALSLTNASNIAQLRSSSALAVANTYRSARDAPKRALIGGYDAPRRRYTDEQLNSLFTPLEY